jgi:acetyl-CoA carboxylase carboxyl transferase subunit alpha
MQLDFETKITEIESKIEELGKVPAEGATEKRDSELASLKKELEAAKKEVYSHLTPWQTVQVARHPQRPLLRDYIAGLFTEFIELHGDRCFGDDHGIIGGLATIEKYRVMVLGHQKGKTVEENIKANFGMASPDGYRKALRLMKLAEKYNIPVVTFIDTPGAYPGMEAEARGQAEAIARNLTEMASLQVPIIVVVTGEGGSGGALGIAVGDSILMLSHAVYSVISPEGCASILFRDGARAPDAAEALKITATSLMKLKIIDEIVPEPLGGAHRDYPGTMANVKAAILKQLKRLSGTAAKKLQERRYDKFAAMGRFKK